MTQPTQSGKYANVQPNGDDPVTREMVERAARALVPFVAGALAEDRWTLEAAEAVLRAGLERRQW